ncbi:SpoIID/LytB domain-containing protein [Clostridium sp.]|jgi:SpoIID/LytB domain protein|uniref:SpoIID/LytB domain-containing protein n=1 Tax=Clostridium sp. TaxID=1506 RepID=UPI003EEC17E1
MKNKIKIFTAVLLACIFILGSNVYAFTNSNYYDNQNIKIGISSMARPQLNITLSGDYTVNGVMYESGTSYLLKVIGTHIEFDGDNYDNLEFIPKTTLNTIKIVSSTPSRSNYYLGTMEFNIDSTSEPSKLLPINTLYIEDYLKGVVGKEMSNSFPIEALKVQAVAARNYAIVNIGKYSSKGYDLDDTTSCQVYAGYDPSIKKVIAAVDATRGTLLLSGQSIVAAYYSASDGGYTESSENVWWGPRDYLKAKPDSYDGYDGGYVWNQTYTTSEINGLFKIKLPLNLNDTFVKIDMDTITKFDSGRIKNIDLIFSNPLGVLHTLTYTKEAARTFLNLKSSLYDVTYNTTTDTYTFDGKGWGHGIGMSQIGAKNRAADGHTFDDILKFYYDGTTLVNVLSKINTISVDNNKIYTYDNPSFNVTTSGGSGKGLTYKYVIENNSTTVYDSDFISSSKLQYKPTEAGNYTLKVYVNDIDSEIPFEASETFNFNVEAYLPPAGVTATTGYNSILLKWTKSPEVVTSGYEVYRSTSSTGTYTSLESTADASYTNVGLTTDDTYYYKIKAYRMDGTVKVYSDFSTSVSSKATNVIRLSGSNRTETSIAIAKQQYTDKVPDAVVLATATNFADALAGSGLAYKYNAPLLLVNKTVNRSKNILDYIKANLTKDKKIYILGGTGAVSEEISEYLTTTGYEIIRLGGDNRYETNQKIVENLNIPKETSIVLTTGTAFADALSISSIADIKGYPILLNGKNSLEDSVSDYITDIQPTTIYMIGGTGALSANIETEIKSLDSKIDIVRLGGANRYETSMKILEHFGLNTDTVAVATGIDFPDALSGSVLAARLNSNVLLVDNKNVTKQKELLNKKNIINVIVFGGDSVISENIASSLVKK